MSRKRVSKPAQLKVQWTSSKKDPANGGYNEETLMKMFSKVTIFIIIAYCTCLYHLTEKNAVQQCKHHQVLLIICSDQVFTIIALA